MRKIHRWWKGVFAVPVVLALSGCATVAKTVEAGKATLDIIGGASSDIESVWNASGKKVTDATGMTSEAAPAPSK